MIFKKNVALNIFFGFLVFIVAAFHSAKVYKQNYHQSQFYQTWFAPAAKLACGQGFTNFNEQFPESVNIKNFLYSTETNFVETLKCEDVINLPSAPLMPYHHFNRYLISSVGLIWKYKGISWKNVYVLAAALSAISWLAVMLLFSLIFPVWASSVITLFYLHFSIFDTYVIYLRDYSKTPFFLLFIYFLIKLLINIFKKEKLIKLVKISLILGLILGVSIGFRIDLKILILPFLCICTITLAEFKSKQFQKFFLLVLSFLIPYYLIGSPMLLNDEDTHTNWHVILLGFSDMFDTELEVTKDTYSKYVPYMDAYAASRIYTFNKRYLNLPDVLYSRPNYDVVGKKLFLEWVKLFPFDFSMRMFYSIKKILLLPSQQLLKKLNVNVKLLLVLPYLGFTILLIYLAGATVLRSTVATFTLLFIFSFPSLQFSQRHYFHFEPLVIFLAFIPIYCLYKIRQKILSREPLFQKNSLKNYSLNFSILFFVTIVCPSVLHFYQKTNLQFQFTQVYESKAVASYDFDVVIKGEKPIVKFDLYKNLPVENQEVLNYLKLTFDLSKCKSHNIKIQFNWTPKAAWHNLNFFKEYINIPEEVNKGYIFMPAFKTLQSSLTEIEFSDKEQILCLESIEKINIPESLKVLPYFFIFAPIENIDFSYNTWSIFKLDKYFLK